MFVQCGHKFVRWVKHIRLPGLWRKGTFCWQKQGYKFSDEFVTRHSAQTALEKCSGPQIVRRDAGEIEICGIVRLDFAKEIVSATQNIETPRLRGIQSQATQITNASWLAINVSLANRAVP